MRKSTLQACASLVCKYQSIQLKTLMPVIKVSFKLNIFLFLGWLAAHVSCQWRTKPITNSYLKSLQPINALVQAPYTCAAPQFQFLSELMPDNEASVTGKKTLYIHRLRDIRRFLIELKRPWLDVMTYVIQVQCIAVIIIGLNNLVLKTG